MTISQGRHLNFTLHLTIQMSEHIVFRFTVQNFGTVYSNFPKTLQIQHISQYLKNDVLSLYIKPLKFEFIFSYYCNLCFSFFLMFLFCFVLYIRCFLSFFLLFSYYTFLLYITTYTLTFSTVMDVILLLSCCFNSKAVSVYLYRLYRS